MSTMRAYTREFRESAVGLVLSEGLSRRPAPPGPPPQKTAPQTKNPPPRGTPHKSGLGREELGTTHLIIQPKKV